MNTRGAVEPPLRRWVCRGQGWYYVVGGLWPWVSPGSFQSLLGRKTDFWLAETVGLQLAVCGLVLLFAARARRITREIALLGGLSAFAFGAMDVYCVHRPETTSAYLVDAPVEFAIAVAWVAAARPGWGAYSRERSL